MSVPRYSLVIPAYNEEAYLPRMLDTVDAARAHYAGGGEAIEVIVSDNDSTDGTREIAEARGCRLAHQSKRNIGAARNAGAAVARGEVLCFADADLRIHPETFNVIDGALRPGVVAGATGVKLERWSPGLLATWVVMIPMVWVTKMDTGVVFCRRADFDAMGGYDESLAFAEDVAFLIGLRRLGRRDRRRLVRPRGAKAIASMRKFDRHGDWHYFTMLPAGLRAIRQPDGGRSFADRFWYDDDAR